VWHREQLVVIFEILNGGSPARAHNWERREGRTLAPTTAVVEVRGRRGAQRSTLPFWLRLLRHESVEQLYVSVKKNCGGLTEFKNQFMKEPNAKKIYAYWVFETV
jgi:hypothetical protein